MLDAICQLLILLPACVAASCKVLIQLGVKGNVTLY